MKKGDSVKGLVGWEWRGAPAMDLPGMKVVAEGTPFINGKAMGRYTSTIYDGPKGNVVFMPPRSGGRTVCPVLPGIRTPQGTGSLNKARTSACSRLRITCLNG